MRNTFTAMLESKALQANGVHVLNTGSLEDRAKKGLELHSTGAASGSRIIIKIADAA
jgi:hypothetical protein